MTTPSDFYARVLAHADAEGRLPMPAQSMWEIFPFELDGLRTKPLEPLSLPEPPRGGEGDRPCRRCANPGARTVWSDERWELTGFGEPLGVPFGAALMPKAHLDLHDLDDVHAAELGLLTVRVDRAVRTLDGMHLVFYARPAGLLQLRGSNLPLWEEMLPRVPGEEMAANLRTVARALAADGGRAHV
jgi:hypothetical protein